MKVKLNRLLVSGMWTAIIICTLCNNDILMYIALMVSTMALVYYTFGQGYKIFKGINIAFGCMICICLLGLFWNFTEISIRNLVSLIAVMVVINLLCIVSASQYNTSYIIYISLLLEVIFAIGPSSESNTKSGLVVFISMCAIMQIISKKQLVNNSMIKKCYYNFLGTLTLGLAVYISLRERARTALLVAVVIVCTYFILKCMKMKNCHTKREFYTIVLIGVIAIFVYIYITTFEWYDSINYYSVAWFGKNIDSSRPGIWKDGLESLGNRILCGLGTGIQPKDLGIRVFESFHNSFIQLLVQNGLVALFCLIYVLSEFWVVMRARIEDSQVKFIIACFIGILVYNCFETTLLSNKLTLGLSQWVILAMGYAKAKTIPQNVKLRGIKVAISESDSQGSVIL